ncbi:hypothetical protein ACLOJK_031443 [Asimina triloba]
MEEANHHHLIRFCNCPPPLRSTVAARNLRGDDGPHVVVRNLIEQRPIYALMLLANEISLCEPPTVPLRRNTLAAIFVADCLAYIFQCINESTSEEEDSILAYPKLAVLCFREMFMVLRRVRSLIEACSNGSKIVALMLIEEHSVSFRNLAKELAEMLGFFPWRVFSYVKGAKALEGLMGLVKQGCENAAVVVDKSDSGLGEEIFAEMGEMQQDIFPVRGRVEKIFEKLGIEEMEGRVQEMKMLEWETRERGELREGLTEFISYCKFVIMGHLWPNSNTYERDPAADWIIPESCRCPITKAVMKSPVAVSTQVMYDKANIRRWIDAGNKTCPVTGVVLDASSMTPASEIQTMIEEWCKEYKILLRPAEGVKERSAANYVVEKLFRSWASPSATDRVIREVIAQMGRSRTMRVHLGEAGVLPLLLRCLYSDHPPVQKTAMEAIHTLSIEYWNKQTIMEAKGGLPAVVDMLKNGQTSDARGEAAATIYRLATVRSYQRLLERYGGVVEELVRMMRKGTQKARRWALAAILRVGSEEVKLGEVELLLGTGQKGEMEEVMRVVYREPVPQLLEEIGRTAKSKGLRKKARKLMKSTTTWLWIFERLSKPGVFD